MTDELAAMPQSMLREVVLRLVCPEKTPPIRAESALEFRELQATESLRSVASRRLARSPEALDFLNRFNAEADLLDEIATLFLDAADAPVRGQELLNPYVVSTFHFEDVDYAYRVVMLGASRAVAERLMARIVQQGWTTFAETLAERLGRSLAREEVLRMVESYTRGATYSNRDDQRWPQFAAKHLGPEAGTMVSGWIAERNRRARYSWD